MEDNRIVELYWQRNEAALRETQNKYGGYCYTIAYNILQNNEDAEEIVNDACIGAWNAIPPHRPAVLSAFLGKITRRLALNKRREQTAGKRGGGAAALVWDELEDCIPSGQEIDAHLKTEELGALLNAFLGTLPVTERRVFLRRYWYFDSIREISVRFGFSDSKVKMMLKRTRDRLRVQLRKEDIWI